MIDSPTSTRDRPIAAPFAAPFPVRTAQDVQRLQAHGLWASLQQD